MSIYLFIYSVIYVSIRPPPGNLTRCYEDWCFLLNQGSQSFQIKVWGNGIFKKTILTCEIPFLFIWLIPVYQYPPPVGSLSPVGISNFVYFDAFLKWDKIIRGIDGFTLSLSTFLFFWLDVLNNTSKTSGPKSRLWRIVLTSPDFGGNKNDLELLQSILNCCCIYR